MGVQALAAGTVVSVSKEGRVAVHQLAAGYFPMKHIAPACMTISPLGQIAFQRSTLKQDGQAPLPRSASRKEGDLPQQPVIVVGTSTNSVRLARGDGAEGGAFDPVIIRVLAENYKYISSELLSDMCQI